MQEYAHLPGYDPIFFYTSLLYALSLVPLFPL